MSKKVNVTDFKLFPVLIKHIEGIVSEDQVKDIVDFIKTKNKLKFNDHGAMEGNSISTHETFNLSNILSDLSNNVESCKDLVSDINKYTNQFASQHGMGSSNIWQSWASIQYKNSSLLKHTHPMSTISGVLYLNVDDNSSPIFFYNPNPFMSYVNDDKSTEFTYEWYSFKPKNGDMYLFSSWLSHGSHSIMNQTDERIIISFNCMY